MTQTFSDRSTFEAAIEARFAKLVPPELASSLAHGVIGGEAAWRAEPARPGETALNLRIGRYLIRDDDLPIIETIGTAASALAATGATGGIALPTLIPALTGLATLAWKLWRKGTKLTREDLALIAVLQRHDAGTAEQLLPLAQAAGVEVLTKEALEAKLRRLGDLETRDGTVIKLAKRAEDGTWRAALA